MTRRTFNPGRALAWVAMIVVLVVTVFPFWWMIRTALTPAADIYTDNTGLLPDHPTLVNFARILGLTSEAEARAAGGSGARLDFARYLLNSVIYCGLIAAVQTLFCAMAGYAFARLRFPGRDLVFGIVIAALMVPPIFTLLPNFILVKDLGLMNTMAGMVAPTILMTPFAVFFLRQFFLSLPRDVEEAAILDGNGPWGIFWRIALPMSRGPLITIGLTTTVWAWKDFLWPLLVGRNEENRLVTVALGVFLQQSPNTQPDWTGLMAASTLSVLPVLVLLVLMGKRLVQSLNFTGSK
ncbi:multiple sugar transport system permease protein [Allocatelliglobosispora scoriae]|uniref:Multiple sugar transport system permease protein n=1 Tax=Allocatelliglobosispora scoriae TaxID=643052 RepID=A0A841BN09_9ACTN|nr:carbohydrate ABC transporter permease [Allocatelliglobosispora scoriae]MBB5868132.1 multiple sugar transport system permease protein [Allocatelliglobosispora scoriae]